MGDLHEKYPDDDEIATFYAVSLLSAARALGDNTFRFEMRAGTIALDVFNRNPNHPGAPHYAIHSFDDPIHAPLALESAVRYAEIAPAVAHARHMPTHIFIQHGMWDMVSGHNQFAYDAARALWETGDSVGDTVHALDWGQYGDLQRGDYEKAQLWIDRLEIVTKESGGQNRASNSLPLLRARYIVETEKWKTAEITEDSPSTELLATGLSAVKTGDLETAEKAAAALKEAGSGNNQVMHKEVTASILAARGETDAAITLMDEAVEITLGMRPPNGAANPVKPTFELYGEILLGFGHYEDAIEKFETSLLRMPNRARSILGLARAHAKIGNEAAATEQYRKLVNIRGEHETLPDYKEAVGFLKEAKLKQAAKER
jgi:tetratricopeptide (TPR) repeat protein